MILPVALASRFCSLMMFALLSSGLRAQVTSPMAQDAGCVRERGGYTCNLAGLKLSLEHSHTFAVDTQRLDRVAAHQLEHMALAMDKVPTSGGSTADLTFHLEPVTPSGVVLGPADHELANLRVTAPGKDGSPVLLWVETLRGQGDRPWPAQVHALLEQFEAHLGIKDTSR